MIPQYASSGYLRLGGNVPGKHVEPEKFTPFEQRKPGDLSVPDPRASAASPADMEPGPPQYPVNRAMATGMGYTGDQCSHCSSMRMKISGHCLVCEDCGTTTGCS